MNIFTTIKDAGENDYFLESHNFQKVIRKEEKQDIKMHRRFFYSELKIIYM